MTTLIPTITEIRLVDVLERGVPNKERIALKVEATIDIGSYALVLGVRAPGGAFITPIPDSMFWFGSATVNANDWIFVYTGSGTPSKVPPAGDVGNVYIIHWGRPHTVFHDPQIVPALWRISGLLFPPPPAALPQPHV
jgi:hypothetical protein